MIDPEGRAVSHNVIVLDSMIKTLSVTMTGKVAKRQAQVYEIMCMKRIMTTDEVADARSFVEEFTSMCEIMGKKME